MCDKSHSKITRSAKVPRFAARWSLAAATITLLAACSSSSTPPAAPTTHAPAIVSKPAGPRMVPLVGTFSLTSTESWSSDGNLHVGARCFSEAGYDDIAPGAEVVISDDAGRTLAITQLGSGHISPAFDCLFRFRARVPAGKGFYGIQVTHRGVIKFPERALGHVVLTLG